MEKLSKSGENDQINTLESVDSGVSRKENKNCSLESLFSEKTPKAKKGLNYNNTFFSNESR